MCMNNNHKKLSHKQERFAQEFLFDGNKAKASIRAGYSKNNAASTGLRLYKTPHIRARIDELMKLRSERTQIDSDYVLTRLGEMDQLDISDILDDEWNFLPISEWPKAWRRSISGFDVSMAGKGDDIEFIKKIKWPEKSKIVELIQKHISLMNDAKDDNDKNDLPVIQIIYPDNGR